MRSILTTRYGLILFALMLGGVEFFCWYYLVERGQLQQVLQVDASHLSLVIVLIYLLASVWFMWIAFVTSRQYLDMQQQSDSTNPLLREFFKQVAADVSADKIQPMLEVLDTRLRSSYAFGFIVADLMLKLGLLGTVIGFIIMLGSLNNLNSIDITVMQSLLAEMSSGMKVALYTTLVGMLAGIILNIKFNLLDWSVDHLLNDIKEKLNRQAMTS